MNDTLKPAKTCKDVEDSLKPCPFCGSRAVLKSIEMGARSVGQVLRIVIGCSRCEAEIDHTCCTAPAPGCVPLGDNRCTIDLWNTRPKEKELLADLCDACEDNAL